MARFIDQEDEEYYQRFLEAYNEALKCYKKACAELEKVVECFKINQLEEMIESGFNFVYNIDEKFEGLKIKDIEKKQKTIEQCFYQYELAQDELDYEINLLTDLSWNMKTKEGQDGYDKYWGLSIVVNEKDRKYNYLQQKIELVLSFVKDSINLRKDIKESDKQLEEMFKSGEIILRDVDYEKMIKNAEEELDK